jgi:ABC-2 type transport system ATP-binding protein
MNAIEVDNLQKVYRTTSGFWKKKTRTINAVNGISFNVRRGELFGLLGPNGAGKTTTVKMLTTLLLPSGGQSKILGLDVARDYRAVREVIGFTFGGGRGLYSRLSAEDNLKYFAELYSLEPTIARKRIAELIEAVGLKGREKERVETYSNGMQQRLHLARALLHNPRVIFLDEPSVGIDPVGARELRAIIKNLIAMHKTVLLTTHYMYEAEELCDRIAIIKGGNIVALDTPTALKRQISQESVIEIQVSGSGETILNRLNDCLNKARIHIEDRNSSRRISIQTYEPESILEIIAPFLNNHNIEGLEVRNPTLEDVYVSIIQAEN